jgi:hypothetical protein
MEHYFRQNPNATTGQAMAYYKQQKNEPSLTESELTKRALGGDEEAKAILNSMLERRVQIAEAQGSAMARGRIGDIVDIDGAATAIVQGRELMSNVKNTFGVPVQEAVRSKVLEMDPNFDFVKPKIKYDAIKSSQTKLINQRTMMGSFVNNLNKQVGRVNEIMRDLVNRFGVRAIDLPMRELRRRAKGSGVENIVEAYTLEISNEIGKLSTGSERSIRELSTDAQERWARIHDPNLSFNQLKQIMDETSHMANMRVESVEEQIDYNMGLLENLTGAKDLPKPKTQADFDKLKSGTIYIDPDDNKKYRKP